MFDVPDAGVYSNYKNPVRNCKQVWPSGCWCVDLDTSRFLTQYQQFGRGGGVEIPNSQNSLNENGQGVKLNLLSLLAHIRKIAL